MLAPKLAQSACTQPSSCSKSTHEDAGIALRTTMWCSYQATPKQTAGRKRMKYLMENPIFADTYFNVWPIPVVPIANMA